MTIIKLVLFDVGNVIVRATHKITEAILWDLGVRPDKVALFFHNPAYGQFARGNITGEQFACEMRDVLDAPYLTDEQIRAAHDAHIYMMDEAVMGVLIEIKEEDVLLAFVTTTNEWQTGREKQFINLAGLGPVVRSHEIGMTKTDKGAWKAILGQLKYGMEDAPNILLVDDARANCDTAARAHLQTYMYDPTPVVGAAKLREELQRRGALR